MQRISSAALALLAAIVLGGAIYVIANNHAAPQTSTARTPTTAAASKAVPVPTVVSTPAATTKPVVAFLGDDWTAGTAASSDAKRFTTIVSRDLGLVERNFGAAGTGYAKSSGTAGPYAGRVDAIVAAHPSVVVVCGGRNDVIDDLATASAQVTDLFRKLHRRLPGATLIAVAPMWGDSDKPPELLTISAAVKQAVTAVGGTYVDLADPIHGHADLMATGADPSDAGYAAIAAAVGPALRPLVTQ